MGPATTARGCCGAAGAVPRLTVVTHDHNRGYGAARCGAEFAAATKDLVFYTDGDGQYDVREPPAC